MEEGIVTTLIKDYKQKIKQVRELALDTICEIEIPVFNNLSSLDHKSFLYFMKHVDSLLDKSSISEKSFILTLLTDVITLGIKHRHYYDICVGNPYQYIVPLCAKISLLLRNIKYAESDDVKILDLHLKKMEKYAERIDNFSLNLTLKNSRNLVNEQIAVKNSRILTQNNTLSSSNKLFCTISVVDRNPNGKITNFFKPPIEIDKKENIELVPTKKVKYSTVTEESNEKLISNYSEENKPKPKTMNAFDILMSSRKTKR